MSEAEHAERQGRVAKNQSLFREVNERVMEIGEAFDADLSVDDFLCECADARCTERLSLTGHEYEAVRQDGRTFAVLPGHVVHDAERVTARFERYWVVEKVAEAGRVAAELDPRRS